MSSVNGKAFENSRIRSINMSSYGSNSSGSNWPIVPIFGRRKRPRQAFYASPSQDLYNTEDIAQNHFSNKNRGNKGKTLTYEGQNIAAQLEDDISLADFDYEDTLQTKSHQTKQNSDALNNSNWPKRTMIDQRAQSDFFRPQIQSTKSAQTIPLEKHPRNKLKTEREVKFIKENEQSTTPGPLKEQRKEAITTQKKQDDQSKSQQKRSMVPRMLTVTTRDINEIMRYKEMLFALYEVYGILDSQVTSNNGQCDKRFIIRDSFGKIQCIFWEIDRPFPHIRRGTSIRSVGRLVNETFQCLSIRATNQAEINNSKPLQMQSREVIDNYLLTSREY